jgi:hypothetical protein
MTEQQMETACETLWRHWREGSRLAMSREGIRPSTRTEGYSVQACLERRSAFPLYGWKIARRANSDKCIVVGPPTMAMTTRGRFTYSGATCALHYPV